MFDMVSADKDVDARYKVLRDRYGTSRAEANGYRFNSFFEREQRLLLEALDRNMPPFLDVACGSGLMLHPLLAEGYQVVGLDYNADACDGRMGTGLILFAGMRLRCLLTTGQLGRL